MSYTKWSKLVVKLFFLILGGFIIYLPHYYANLEEEISDDKVIKEVWVHTSYVDPETGNLFLHDQVEAYIIKDESLFSQVGKGSVMTVLATRLKGFPNYLIEDILSIRSKQAHESSPRAYNTQ